MGFMVGKFATAALLSVKGAVTAKSYNAAVRNLKNVKTDMLCKPWYVGNNLAYHIPNNTDITVTYKGGKVVHRRTSASQSRRSTRSSRRRVPGRSSSS